LSSHHLAGHSIALWDAEYRRKNKVAKHKKACHPLGGEAESGKLTAFKAAIAIFPSQTEDFIVTHVMWCCAVTKMKRRKEGRMIKFELT
jgi:hypothetical protein